MIYEIRNYYFKPERFDAYKDWVKNDAIGYLKTHLNLIGFWVNTDRAIEITGAEMDNLGSANITWIIGWEDIDSRAATMAGLFESAEWNDIFEKLPGGLDGYLRMECKFSEAIG